MDDRNVIAIMAAGIYAARTGHREFGSREGMDNAVDEARMLFGLVKSLADDDLVMRPENSADDLVNGARKFIGERLVKEADAETPAALLEEAFRGWVRFRGEAVTEDEVAEIANSVLPVLRVQPGITYTGKGYNGVRLSRLTALDAPMSEVSRRALEMSLTDACV